MAHPLIKIFDIIPLSSPSFFNRISAELNIFTLINKQALI